MIFTEILEKVLEEEVFADEKRFDDIYARYEKDHEHTDEEKEEVDPARVKRHAVNCKCETPGWVCHFTVTPLLFHCCTNVLTFTDIAD